MGEGMDNINDFVNYVFIEKKLSKNTKDAYFHDLVEFYSFVESKHVADISSDDIRDFINYLYDNNESQRTISRKLVSIRTFFDYLVKTKVIKENPCEKIESPKLPKTLPKTLTVNEVTKLLEYEPKTPLEYRNKMMIELMYATGLRVSELVNLNVCDINLEEGFVRCYGKGKKERIVPLADITVSMLKDYINTYRNSLLKGYLTDKLFISSYGKGITRQGFFKILKQIGASQGIKKEFSPHTLRHSFATHLLENGADIRSIGELLGHENIKTTQIYTHLSNPKIKRDYEEYNSRDKI